MRYFLSITVMITCCFSSIAYTQPKKNSNPANGAIKIVFRNFVHDAPLVLYDSSYINPFGEHYTITKLKYYITNTGLYAGSKSFNVKDDYHLIDQSVDTSLSFILSSPINKYDSIQFLVGVDSAANTSGAQTGALDPMNDMFWTWNSGYVMEKIEGTSPESNVVNNKIEYHIGGFTGPNSVLNKVIFKFNEKPLEVIQDKMATIFIDLDLDKFWNAVTGIKITGTPVCTQPGDLAKKISINFSSLFKLSGVSLEK